MSGEKTEQPTQHRLDDRRKEGQVPQRKNVVEAFLLIITVLVIMGLLGRLAGSLLTLATTVFSGIDLTFDDVKASSFQAAMDVMYLVFAICALTSVFTLLFGLLLNKFNFAPKSLTPKFNKLNPVNQLKGIFSKATLYNFIRMVIYFSSISILLYTLIVSSIDDSINASYCGEICLYALFSSRIKIAVVIILVVLTILAAADFRIQTRLFISQNKMSKDEVKREHKDQEGNPEIKAGRRSIAMNDSALPRLSDATHVIHSDQVLVAIIFYPTSYQGPYVVFKARGARVPSLCRRFRAWNIPTVQLPSGALDLYRMANPGQYLPAKSASIIAKMLSVLENPSR